MKHTLIFCLLMTSVVALHAQAEIKLPYKPANPDPAPVMYNAPGSPAPATTRAAATTPAMSNTGEQDAAARRAAALAKVQGKQTPAPASVAGPMAVDARSVAPVTYSTSTVVLPEPEPSTTVTVNGLNVQRTVRPGRGQVGNELFTPVSELHFVQFAVYCKDTPVDKAPAIEGLYLLWHPGSTCPGGAKGASYIVKGYTTPEEAKAAVASFKARGIECWYNPALTGAEVEIIGVR